MGAAGDHVGCVSLEMRVRLVFVVALGFGTQPVAIAQRKREHTIGARTGLLSRKQKP